MRLEYEQTVALYASAYCDSIRATAQTAHRQVQGLFG